MIHIIVCLKIVIDPEVPLSLFKIDSEQNKPIPPMGMPPVFSPFDLNALEAALKIKDRHAAKITVLSMGKSLPKALLQKVLAMGADEAVAVEGPEFEHADPFTTVHTLVTAIQRIGSFDLICTGRQSADWDSGLVWAGLAEELDLPCITIARAADIRDATVVVERCVCDGIETLEAELPALVTFSSEVGEPRYASLPALMKAKKKEITKWTAADMDVEPTDTMVLDTLYAPDLGRIDCRFISGENGMAKGRLLANMLQDQGILFKASESNAG